MELQAQLDELKEEVASLAECLLASGAVKAKHLVRIKRQKHAFRVWQEVVSLPELCINIAVKSGLAAAKNLSMVSRVHGHSLSHVMPAVVEQTPAQLVAIGGAVRFSPPPGPGEEMLVLDQVDVLDVTASHWTPLTCMQQGIVGCAAAVLGSCLYVVGGQLSGHVLDTLYTFDPGVKEDWRLLASMPTRRSLCAAVSAGGALYVTGGHDHMGQPKGSMEMYDPKADGWTKLSPMHTARFACGATSSGCCMYIFGGKSRLGAIRGTAEGFNLPAGTWFTLPPMPTARAGCAAAALAGKLYVAGGESLGESAGMPGSVDIDIDPAGEDDLHTPMPSAFGVLEVFCTSVGTWSSLALMPTARGACAAATVAGRIYVLGGVSENGTTLCDVECFDPVLGQWTVAPPLDRPRARCAAVALRR